MIYYSIYKYLVKSSEKSFLMRICYKILYKIRNFVIRYYDPIILFDLWGFKYKLPLSHDLPTALKFYPRHNQNLSRIAKLVKKKYTDLKIIDVGANVGDTVALLRKDYNYPILSIEGDEKFYWFLQRNVENMKDISIENQFIGDENVERNAILKTVEGSSTIIECSNQSDKIRFVKLTDILQKHKKFLSSKLLKIDTDGFDVKVIFGSRDFLLSSKPVIFFEYEPRYFNQNNVDGFSVFSFLKELGYSNLIVFQQFGDYMLSSSLSNNELLQDLHCYFSVKNAGRYCDICVFSEEDKDLFKLIRSAEIEYHLNL